MDHGTGWVGGLIPFLDEGDAAAERRPGFVWRLQGAGALASGAEAFTVAPAFAAPGG